MHAHRTRDFDSLSPKPMRKGTHSCLECRRKKIRCVVEPHARKCNPCLARGLRCTDQELRRSRSPNVAERKSTRDRLRDLEGVVDKMLYNESRVAGVVSDRRSARVAQEPWEVPAAEERIATTEVQNIRTKDCRKGDCPEVHSTRSQNFSDQPLLDLFKDIDVDEKRDRHAQGGIRGPHIGLSSTDESAHRSLLALRTQIPNSKELISLIRAGSASFSIWSGAFPDALGSNGDLSPERLRDHIYACLHSDTMADAAKVALCLALHIQQMPTGFEATKLSLLASLHDLQDMYVAAAENLLALDAGPAGTLAGLECMILQSDFYVNEGCLRKVWLIVRRAVSLAQLMGLQHKIDLEMGSKPLMRRSAIWTELWQRDRGFSLVLGLPCATLESHIHLPASKSDHSDQQKIGIFLRGIGTVMGHIIRRDQDPNGTNYSTTLKIEEELEECQSIMSAAWWDFSLIHDTPTEVLCIMFVVKMRFYTVQRLLHLPFLLKAFENERYQSSRLAVLQSSRAMISVYNVLRDEERPILRTCEMVDFQVFTAAMTLVVNLLACPQSHDHRDLLREECDWQLVFQTTEKLKRVSQSMRGCKVATLGARVLKDFSSVRTASAEEACGIDVPYFGRLEIQRRRSRHNEHVPGADIAAQTANQSQAQPNLVTDLAASANAAVSTDGYFFPLSAASQPQQETDESWLHMLDPRMVDDWHMLDSNLADDWNWFPRSDQD